MSLSDAYDPAMHLPIHTERLTLRAHTTDDLDAHNALLSDPGVVAYLYEGELSRDEAAEHLAKRLGSELPGEGAWLNLAVEFDDQVIGDVGVCLISHTHRQCEIGYVFSPSAGRTGLRHRGRQCHGGPRL